MRIGNRGQEEESQEEESMPASASGGGRSGRRKATGGLQRGLLSRDEAVEFEV